MTQPAEPTPTAPAPVPAAPVPAPTPAPPPAPVPPAPQPTPTPAPQAPGVRLPDPDAGEGLPYYQEGVPWRQLPPEQQVAYWMHRSRKHEDRVSQMRDYDELRSIKTQYDQLLTQSQTEHERAIAEARRQGETTAMARANTMLVEAYVRSAAAARGVDDEAVSDFLDTTRLDAFISASTGQVDTAKVYRQVSRMAGAGASAVTPAGVPAAPAVPAPPMNAQPPQPPAAPGWPQQQPPAVPGQPAPQYVQGGYPPAGSAVAYNAAGQPVPAAPQWPGHVPAAPTAPGHPAGAGGPDYGQGQFQQAPPSGLEAGRAAARARFNKTSSTSQAA
jgi:hypothetical protein